MGDSIQISASMRMECDAETVRQQYRDIDHHIRNNVHPGIHYQWEPAAPGERKIRTTFRILGVPQYDVSLLEDAEDGSFIIRYLEGSNAGMVLVHRFVPLGPNATDVQLSANAPSTPGRRLLGPLFVAGARQVMKRALMEDKRDLERNEFRPGVARGKLEFAFARALKLGNNAEQRAQIEAACLLACADGELAAAERDALERLLIQLHAEHEAPFVAERSQYLARAAESQQIEREARRIGQAARELGVATEAVQVATVLGLVSEGLSVSELALLRVLSDSAGISAEQLSACVEAVDQRLTARHA